MSVVVRYHVPVQAEVALSAGEFSACRSTTKPWRGPEDVFAVDAPPLRDSDQRRAANIAE